MSRKKSRRIADGEEVFASLMQPLFDALPEDKRNIAMSLFKCDPTAVLSWGVESGYFLWVRTHAGEKPTEEQIYGWLRKVTM